jgi:DNA mismatch endonuclease (patch repair protein)
VRHDPLSPKERSARMSLVRSHGNRSTETRVAAVLIRTGIRGWRRNATDIPGKPDFFFPGRRLVIFVDGCFWHGCPACRRNTPKNRAEFWEGKIEANKRRDRRIDRKLRKLGYRVVRIWEHCLADKLWARRLMAILARSRAVRRR